MKNSCLAVALLLALAAPIPLRGQSMPLMRAVEPISGTYGDELTATGENLDQAHVTALYLTDGKNDIKLVITSQTAELIKFKIPAGMKAGRFALLILTSGKTGTLIEEPVKVTVTMPGQGPTSE